MENVPKVRGGSCCIALCKKQTLNESPAGEGFSEYTLVLPEDRIIVQHASQSVVIFNSYMTCQLIIKIYKVQ